MYIICIHTYIYIYILYIYIYICTYGLSKISFVCASEEPSRTVVFGVPGVVYDLF